MLLEKTSETDNVSFQQIIKHRYRGYFHSEFADSFGGSSFLKQHYKQMLPELLQYLPNACVFYTIFAIFRPFKFREEEITGIHDVNVPSYVSNYT